MNLCVKFQFLFFGQGPTLTETINETLELRHSISRSLYLTTSRRIWILLKPHTFLHESALRPHEISESDHRNHRSPEWLKTPVRVHTSLLESSSNARLCGEGLHDDTKNRCLTHYVHMNPEKLCRFKNGQIRVNIAFEAYSGTHKRIPCVPGGIRV